MICMKYPNIDMVKTGDRIRKLVKTSGYTVKQIQEYLHLSCPQPIYRWFKGQVLPSLNHLYALSVLFHIHMEDMLVAQENDMCFDITEMADNANIKRLQSYYYKLSQAA